MVKWLMGWTLFVKSLDMLRAVALMRLGESVGAVRVRVRWGCECGERL